jgi:hypothetical protein
MNKEKVKEYAKFLHIMGGEYSLKRIASIIWQQRTEAEQLTDMANKVTLSDYLNYVNELKYQA